jgi:UDP-N-acetylglucosamine 1-carboxyvinyltransferase
MSSFEILGGKKLKGEIVPQGAKNEALQVICATLLTAEKVTIHNIPAIRDVEKLIELLKSLGVVVEKISSSSFTFLAENIDPDLLQTRDFKEKVGSLRGSILIHIFPACRN